MVALKFTRERLHISLDPYIRPIVRFLHGQGKILEHKFMKNMFIHVKYVENKMVVCLVVIFFKLKQGSKALIISRSVTITNLPLVRLIILWVVADLGGPLLYA